MRIWGRADLELKLGQCCRSVSVRLGLENVIWGFGSGRRLRWGPESSDLFLSYSTA